MILYLKFYYNRQENAIENSTYYYLKFNLKLKETELNEPFLQKFLNKKI